MPHLTVPIASHGPVFDVMVGVTSARATALKGAGQNIPQEIAIRALVDTGASATVLDAGVIQQLQLQPTGSIPIHTPSTNGVAHTCSQFDVRFSIMLPAFIRPIDPIPVIGTHLAAQGIQALIGRDILAKCLLVYDGRLGYRDTSTLKAKTRLVAGLFFRGWAAHKP